MLWPLSSPDLTAMEFSFRALLKTLYVYNEVNLKFYKLTQIVAYATPDILKRTWVEVVQGYQSCTYQNIKVQKKFIYGYQ